MPVTLTNDRFQLEMTIAGYEFPDVIHDREDANWLTIQVSLNLVHGAWRWQVEDAGALTWEVEGCVHWLRQLAAGAAVEQETWGFSEPDIALQAVRNDAGSVVALNIHLMDEFQPPTKVIIPREANIVTLRFHTPPETLLDMANGLAADLAMFPQRGTS